ncbi:MAG TPA: hypothetical protein VJI75_06150 [Candidatus Nanoarchaeia archaeon]|nr:hypothetical protein [Candidatus Nanoarchaeia archaeon]
MRKQQVDLGSIVDKHRDSWKGTAFFPMSFVEPTQLAISVLDGSISLLEAFRNIVVSCSSFYHRIPSEPIANAVYNAFLSMSHEYPAASPLKTLSFLGFSYDHTIPKLGEVLFGENVSEIPSDNALLPLPDSRRTYHIIRENQENPVVLDQRSAPRAIYAMHHFLGAYLSWRASGEEWGGKTKTRKSVHHIMRNCGFHGFSQSPESKSIEERSYHRQPIRLPFGDTARFVVFNTRDIYRDMNSLSHVSVNELINDAHSQRAQRA